MQMATKPRASQSCFFCHSSFRPPGLGWPFEWMLSRKGARRAEFERRARGGWCVGSPPPPPKLWYAKMTDFGSAQTLTSNRLEMPFLGTSAQKCSVRSTGREKKTSSEVPGAQVPPTGGQARPAPYLPPAVKCIPTVVLDIAACLRRT